MAVHERCTEIGIITNNVFFTHYIEDTCMYDNVTNMNVQYTVDQGTVQGDPDLESFQSPYFFFRENTLSDLAPSLAICLYVYITICTPPPPHLSPLPYCPQNRGKSEH